MNNKLKNSKTMVNLARTYVGESCARNRYDMLAKLAKKEGLCALHDEIVKIATNEFNHARNIFSFMNSAGMETINNINVEMGVPFKQKLHCLQENVAFSAEDEKNESQVIYPAFAKVAREEGFEDIAKFLENLAKIENCHMMFFEQVAEQLKMGTMYKSATPVKWKCKGCGYEETLKEAWSICPVCMAPQGYVMLKIQDGAN